MKVTLALTVVLVVLVIFLFLRRLAATIIPALSLPISLIGTLALMSRWATAWTTSRCWASRWPSAWWWTTRS